MRICHYCSNYFISKYDKDSENHNLDFLYYENGGNKDKYGNNICDDCEKSLNSFIECTKCKEKIKNKNFEKHIQKCMSDIK